MVVAALLGETTFWLIFGGMFVVAMVSAILDEFADELERGYLHVCNRVVQVYRWATRRKRRADMNERWSRRDW